MFVALGGHRWRARLAIAAVAGLSLYVPGLWWMRDFSLPGYGLAVLVEAAIVALALSVVPGTGPWRRAAAFAAALVLAEAFRGAWPFGGLPLAGIDLGQVDGPLVDVARLGGRLLLVGVVGAAGAGLGLVAQTLLSHEPRPKGWSQKVASVAPWLVSLGLVVGLAVAGHVGADGSTAGSLRVAVVQGGGPRGLRAVDADPERVFEAHVAATQDVKQPVDLVLWPEDVVDVNRPLAGSEQEDILSALAAELGATLVVGIVEDVGDDGFRNAAVAWGPDGRKLDRYDKVHLVPFGERIPLRSLVERVADVSAVPRDAIAGRGPGVLSTPAGRLGVMISYEVFFADRARAATRAGGRVLLVPTNASSFVDAQVPAQELAAARLRAVETGRWVLQAAPTGYSAVIDQRGRVVSRTPLGTRALRHQTVVERTGRTLAVAIGDTPVYLGCLAMLVAVQKNLSVGIAVFLRRFRKDRRTLD